MFETLCRFWYCHITVSSWMCWANKNRDDIYPQVTFISTATRFQIDCFRLSHETVVPTALIIIAIQSGTRFRRFYTIHAHKPFTIRNTSSIRQPWDTLFRSPVQHTWAEHLLCVLHHLHTHNIHLDAMENVKASSTWNKPDLSLESTLYIYIYIYIYIHIYEYPRFVNISFRGYNFSLGMHS